MNTRNALPLTLALVVAAGGIAPAVAAPAKPKPITDEYDVEGVPVPLPITGNEGFGSDSCTDSRLEGISTTTKTIKPTGAGTLTVDVTKFSGDWDITVMSDKGAVLAVGAGTSTPTALAESSVAEKLVLKIKKATPLNIAVCNFGGSPTAHVKFAFVYK